MGRPKADELAELFPGGVAPRAHLVALGWSHSSISRRCRQGGQWSRPIPGVIAFTGGTLTRGQLMRAALAHAGPRAMLTGIPAARLHGVRKLPSDPRVHTLIAHKSKVATWGFAVTERTIHLPEPMTVDDLPVAPLARALIDAARRMNDLVAVRAMIADAVQRGLCDPRDLRDELAQASTIGSALPRIVVGEMNEGVRSATEHSLRQVVGHSGLPAPAWHVELRDPAGTSLGVADAWWSNVGMAVQVLHSEDALEPNTRVEDRQLKADGLIVVPLHPSQLRNQPVVAVQQLRNAYHRASQRPPPKVTVDPAA
ncbi:hypothetical protein [Amycolatopsis sp. H20-H5]|uniref:hypothetical protein n=1 Tax=Amycolatopsis sp. H20-H5 TaxID=3046309 RepID=UPI002DB7EBF5|nr:hypothetical protein [Amycolatopsis sp. H20-H5]MEC3978980.1 hypothetical protein [Amycolatopsis sp. H20-H5]